MSEFGRILSVETRSASATLISPAAVGATTLLFDSTLELEEPDDLETMSVTLDPEGVGEAASYSALDDDLGTITLSTGIRNQNGYEAGTRVELSPVVEEKVAQVIVDDAEEDGEPLDAIIPHALWDAIDDGIRTPQNAESVELDYDGEEYFVTNAIGRQPERDGAFLKLGSVKAEHIGVDSLSAIKAVLGEITSGTITGARVQTDDNPNNARIVLAERGSASNDRIGVYGTAGLVAALRASGGDFITDLQGGAVARFRGAVILDGAPATALKTNGGVRIEIGTANDTTNADNVLVLRNTGAPASVTGNARAGIYFDSSFGTAGAIRAVKQDGTRISLGAF